MNDFEIKEVPDQPEEAAKSSFWRKFSLAGGGLFLGLLIVGAMWTVMYLNGMITVHPLGSFNTATRQTKCAAVSQNQEGKQYCIPLADLLSGMQNQQDVLSLVLDCLINERGCELLGEDIRIKINELRK